MFDYNICNQADNDVFISQCKAIESNIYGLIKEETIEDVDGSVFQKYTLRNLSLTVYNDKEVDAIYIKSDFDLVPYFKKQ
ncbi:MAG: hypothetical protein RR573_04730 [Oscillospiraceae bacterium]